jgi:DNA-binding MarR family transcriptional regulator
MAMMTKPLKQSAAARDSRAELLLRLIHWSSAASRQLRRQLTEMAAAFDLSDHELLVVWLCRDGGRVQVELAGAIGVSPAQMSGIVERLRSRGLVGMHRPTMDRRRQVWRTSVAGQALLDRAAPRLEELAESLDTSVSSAEQEVAESLCQRLADATGAERSAAPTAGSSVNQDEQRVCKEAA